MIKRVSIIFSLVALAAVLLTACTGGIDDPSSPPVVQDLSGNTGNTADTQPDQEPLPESSPPEGESEQDQPDQQDQENQDEQAPVLPPRPELGFAFGDSQLKASDPNQIDLASGELHLVDLFAFW